MWSKHHSKQQHPSAPMGFHEDDAHSACLNCSFDFRPLHRKLTRAEDIAGRLRTSALSKTSLTEQQHLVDDGYTSLSERPKNSDETSESPLPSKMTS
ncbi:unnamed protein product [Dibothriocephalus latus]|uniref:Uncharacterized protein n=1 Tax=Dibothriocephalus latus TaxID=60516 RepID=A0A3P7QM28_DIBLA|nr:unnamed protein product [Dibothriocephalus latus]